MLKSSASRLFIFSIADEVSRFINVNEEDSFSLLHAHREFLPQFEGNEESQMNRICMKILRLDWNFSHKKMEFSNEIHLKKKEKENENLSMLNRMNEHAQRIYN